MTDRPALVRIGDRWRARRRCGRTPVAQPRPTTRSGGAARSSTRSTSGASRTANGDGTGDLAGVRSRLPYLRDLGVDAIWFTPWYVSPLADGGYDVADYRAIDPAFGTLEEAEALIAEALALGIRTIVDVVPNHVSDQHPWFQAALAAGPGSPGARPVLVPPRQGRGRRASCRPAGCPTSGRRRGPGPPTPTARRASGTCTCSRRSSPTSTGTTRTSVREHEDILRFWFDRGVAGVRIDSAALLVKDPALPEVPAEPGPGEHPTTTATSCTTIYRSWRAVADGYPGTRVLVGEVWLPDTDAVRAVPAPGRAAHRVQLRLHGPALGRQPACASRSTPRSPRTRRSARRRPGCCPTTTSRGRSPGTAAEDTSFAFDRKRFGAPTDLDLGRRRARAAALLSAALPGSLYIYQGDELGLDEVDDLPTT